MGKVLESFGNGWPGSVSRSVDNVIISLANGSGGNIPFGAPVFLVSGSNACAPFDPAHASTFSMDNFIGFAVRSADKTPNVFGSNEAVFKQNDLVEILVRGATVLEIEDGADPGSAVYIRKSDGVIVAEAGTSGSTIALTNVRVKTASDDASRSEIIVLERNLL